MFKLSLSFVLIALAGVVHARMNFDDRFIVCGLRTTTYDYALVVDQERKIVTKSSTVRGARNYPLVSKQISGKGVNLFIRSEIGSGQDVVYIEKKNSLANAHYVMSSTRELDLPFTCISSPSMTSANINDYDEVLDKALKLSPVYPFTR